MVTQSCDLTHPSIEAEPHVELIVGYMTERANDQAQRGNFTHGKSARRLCLEIQSNLEDSAWYEFCCHERVWINRSELAHRQPHPDRFLLDGDIETVATWLSQRYRRAALPDDFNKLIPPSDKKVRKDQKNLSPHISAIYFSLVPDRDLEAREKYQINLLATIPADKLSHLESARKSLDSLITRFEQADIDVNARLLREREVSVHAVRGMKRFPLDHFSPAGDEHPAPFDQ
ncbi:MAG: hypothetical protein HND55_13635 [Pseudomonadota bacterium]|nr:MAG: hypothetical protein HND55_13635 [Pseudomonadota bacterium]